MISAYYGLVFIHVPKCAGMAIEAALGGLPAGQRPEQHWTSHQFRTYHPDAWETCERFAVVRHPLARAMSFTRFFRRFDPVWRRHLGHVSDDTLLWHLMMSANLLTTHTADRMITDDVEVLRLEELGTAWPSFAARFDLPKVLPSHNAAPTPTPNDAVPVATELAVAALFEADYTRFGYPLPTTDLAALSPDEQGKVLWARLRALALRHPEQAPADAQRRFVEAVDGWAEALPLPAWRDRWHAATAAHPVDASGGRSTILWTEHVHDHVNAALGRPLWAPWAP